MPDAAKDLLLPQPTEKQLAFIEKYKDKDIKKKDIARHTELNAAWAVYTNSREACINVVWLINSLPPQERTADDFKFVAELNTDMQAAIAKIKPGGFTGSAAFKKATTQIKAVAEDLKALKIKAEGYLSEQADPSHGRDISTMGQISAIIAQAQASIANLKSEFDTKVEELRAKVRKEAPALDWDPEQVTEFKNVYAKNENKLAAIPRKGDGADVEKAKTAAKEAINEVASERGGLLAALVAFAEGDGFAEFLADMRARNEIVVTLKRAREAAEELDRWGSPAAAKIISDAKGIENELEHVFADRSGLTGPELATAKTAQDALLGRAVALGRSAESAVEATKSEYSGEIDKLTPQVEALEARWKVAAKKVGNRQSKPVAAQMAALRLALDGLGGFNTAAIDAIKKMIKVADDLVKEAENIEALNQMIEGWLKDAKTAAKSLTGDANPIADVFTAHIEEIDSFRGSYKEKSLTEASKGASDLLAQVRADEKRNQALIDRRASVMASIAKREQQLVEFDALFQQMLEHAGQTARPYRGSFRDDLDTCISWAETKTDPNFYDTIQAKLSSLLIDIDKEAGFIRLFLTKSHSELMMAEMPQAQKLEQTKAKLAAKEDRARAELARAEVAHQAIRDRINKGEDVPEAEQKAALDAISAANMKRDEIAKELAEARKEFQENSELLNKLELLDRELKASERADQIALDKRKEYLGLSETWLKEVMAELGDKNSVLHDYKGEAAPQIKRVAETRKALEKANTLEKLKDNEAGVNGVAALSELSFAQKFIDGLKARDKQTERKALGKIGEEWDNEILKLNRSAVSLIDAIAAFEDLPEVGGTASKDVEQMFGVILGRMQDHRFETAAKTFNDSEDVQARKVAREQALSEVRRFRALLFNDPLLKKCVVNPFGVPIGSSTANRLDGIELNVLRGI